MQADPKKDKVLVIGSTGHSLADASLEWSQASSAPYLGDFHIIIINLQSLDKSQFVRGEILTFLTDIRNQIAEIIWANTSIICITTSGIGDPPYINYSWCPFGFIIVEKFSGREFDPGDLKGAVGNPYLHRVAEWDHYFEDFMLWQYKPMYRKTAVSYVKPLLRTLSGKNVAFTAQVMEYNPGYAAAKNELIWSKPLTFLPPTTLLSVAKGIDIILETIKGKKREISLPPWLEKILLPGEDDLITSINEAENIIKQKTEDIGKQKVKLQKLQRFKGLLTEDGETLEEIVDEAFRLLGVRLEKVEGFKEDRIYKQSDDVVPIEIKGRSASISERDLTQLIGRLGQLEAPKSLMVRGVLIGNHYKDSPLDSEFKGRKKAFEPNVEEKAKVWNISLLSTLELFKAVAKKLEGEDIKELFFDRVFNQTGIIGID